MYGKVYGYYPLGFRRTLRPGERKLDKSADDRVTEEYVRWQQDRAGFASWSTHEAAIRLGIEMFGNFRRWLMDQQDNPELSPHAWSFIVETIRFINSGQRRINVHTHMSMILMDVESFNKLPVRERKEDLISLLVPTSDTAISHWLRHQGGFSDMVCSLTVFFGNTQPKGSVTWAS